MLLWLISVSDILSYARRHDKGRKGNKSRNECLKMIQGFRHSVMCSVLHTAQGSDTGQGNGAGISNARGYRLIRPWILVSRGFIIHFQHFTAFPFHMQMSVRSTRAHIMPGANPHVCVISYFYLSVLCLGWLQQETDLVQNVHKWCYRLDKKEKFIFLSKTRLNLFQNLMWTM